MIRATAIRSENDAFQIVSSLKGNREKRQRHGEVFVEGIESIKQLAASGHGVTRFLFRAGAPLSAWAQSLMEAHPRAARFELTEALYLKLCDKSEPSELLATGRLPKARLEDFPVGAESVVLLFDRPSDLGNFGTLVRTCDAFGVDAVFLAGHGVDPFDPKAIRASLGSVFRLPIIAVESSEALARWVQAQSAAVGLQVIGSDSGGSHRLSDLDLRPPLMFVVGNEARGMSVNLKSLCGKIASIPVVGSVNSLNVACAGSILLWEWHRKKPDGKGRSK
ncbi:MAG: RNA methyltransferase [Spirochaetes bacterium]|nr:RNA methyltransferase [Spirochaetota bacterium]